MHFNIILPPSSVSVVTRLVWTTGFNSPQGQFFSLPQNPDQLCGPTQPNQWVPGSFHHEIKRLRREAAHSPPSPSRLRKHGTRLHGVVLGLLRLYLCLDIDIYEWYFSPEASSYLNAHATSEYQPLSSLHCEYLASYNSFVCFTQLI